MRGIQWGRNRVRGDSLRGECQAPGTCVARARARELFRMLVSDCWRAGQSERARGDCQRLEDAGAETLERAAVGNNRHSGGGGGEGKRYEGREGERD